MSGGKKIFQSLWDFNGRQYNDLNDVPLDCKVLVVSELPLVEGTTRLLQPRRERRTEHSADFAICPQKGQVDPNSYSVPTGYQQLSGVVNNEFVLKDWESYFATASAELEEKFNSKKKEWFSDNFRDWIQKT